MKKIPNTRPFIPSEDVDVISSEIQKILSSGILTQGPWVQKFEEEFAEYIGSRHAIATNSGTSALEILLRYHNVQDKEVILPTNTFIATGNAVIFAGGKPVLADIHSETLCVDPQDILNKITPKTVGIIVVHIAGLICPHIDEVKNICRQRGFFLIEDAAHAAGAVYSSQKAGVLGDGGAFSFYPTKTMTTGEGGMITTNDDDCVDFARSLRCHGIQIGKQKDKNLSFQIGHNWRMSELQAVLGYFQLRRLEESILKRNQIADIYKKKLTDLSGINTYHIPQNIRHVYYKYPLLLDPVYSRSEISAKLVMQYNIGCGSIYWPPCHLQPVYQERFGYQLGDFPVSEDILNRTIALPIYPQMVEEEVITVKNALQRILSID